MARTSSRRRRRCRLRPAATATRNTANAEAALSNRTAECRLQIYPDQNGVRHALDRENCTASERRAFFDAKRLPSDLTSVLMANRAEIAAELDAGQ